MGQDRVALITGAAGGIGSCLVAAVLDDGQSVIAVDLSAEALAALSRGAEARGHADRLITLQSDLTRDDSVDAIVEAAGDRFGHVDILVNNAGINFSTFLATRPKFWDATAEQWRISVALHTAAPMALTRALVPAMIERTWGRVVNVTTSLGSMISAGSPVYGPSKAALEAYTSIVAKDLVGTGVTANILVPGGVTNTAMVGAAAPYAREDMLQPDVMVPPFRWIISDEATDMTDHRFVAALWDTEIPGEQAAAKAGALAAWGDLGGQPIRPSTPATGTR